MASAPEPEWPLDLGIVLHCTNDDIWNAEIERHDGLIGLRRMCACRSPGACKIGGDRHHFQRTFRDHGEDALLRLMQLVGPHRDKAPEEIIEIVNRAAEQMLREMDTDVLDAAGLNPGRLARLFLGRRG